ncbi:MAG: DUF779 domain-containing protein [Pseudomonadota bacterium]
MTAVTTIQCATDGAVLEGTDPLARVIATQAAKDFLAEIKADHGEVLFHQSGGCCDGSSPMCYSTDDFRIGSSDVKLGEINGTEVFISGPQFEAWKHTQLILDVVPGRGGMFSLDNGREKRFLTRSRVFTDAQLAKLEAA